MDKLNNIKLVVSDLDSTLLDSHHNLPDDFWDVEAQLHQRNILFAIASGRQFYTIKSLFSKGSDRLLFLAENGTYGSYQGVELFTIPLTRNEVVEFIKVGRTLSKAYLVLCGTKSAYVENTEATFLEEVKKYYTQLEIVSDLTQVSDVILKVTLCDFDAVTTNSFKKFQSYQNDYKIVISGAIWLDITNKKAHKGKAIEFIQKKFNITSAETMAFGDYLNDYEMMEQAYYSFAMKNAHKEIVAISNFQTKDDCEHQGVTKTIKELLL
ncbi:Cof-type HAD-IIB family hydrolase [Flavobacterium aciduliphilum]|uniref:Uncharacterized protein n=1 Tax=Flavobacterium aciduliphilum TaxID=1101402 RepID=A0A328YBU9_9FLAO|nr:Cof-type HAD-IIB family hydrolase [Flavobacterium aciduliphilum]RAR69995.1 hypothetical protein CLV55_11438 [Flavobacterium aciduliphilum]